MDLIRKVREVGRTFELNSYKTISQHVKLDAKLILEKYHKARLGLHRLEQLNQKLTHDLKITQSTLNEKTKRLHMTEVLFQEMLQQFQRKLQHNTQNRKFKNQSTQASSSNDSDNNNNGKHIFLHNNINNSNNDVSLELNDNENLLSPLLMGPAKQKCKFFLIDNEQLEHLRRHNKTLGPIRLMDDGLTLLHKNRSHHHSNKQHFSRNKKVLVRYDLPINVRPEQPIPIGWLSPSAASQQKHSVKL